MKPHFNFSFWVLFLFFCSCAGKDKPYIEPITNMALQPSVKAQGEEKLPAVRTQIPEGTVARGQKVYSYKTADEAEFLVNPYRFLKDSKFINKGEKIYSINCSLCHGQKGMGEGSISSKMVIRPPSLLSQQAKTLKDGHIFHIITKGQGIMGSYLHQIPDEKSRWSVVNYVRELQKTYKDKKNRRLC